MKLAVLTILALCHYAYGGLVKIRVDDDIKIYVDGNARYDEFAIPGWQWTTVAQVNYGPNDQVMAFRMFNQGGPGYGRGEIDGSDLFNSPMVCRTFPHGQNPDVLFPGWTLPDFDDSNWDAPNSVWSPVTSGLQPVLQGFWAGPDSNKNALCRVRLNQPKHTLKIRCDDEVQVMLGCKERANAFKMPGWQWQHVFTIDYYGTPDTLALRMFNQGGPGNCLTTLDNKDISGAPWKCTTFQNGGNPDALFPNWCAKNFDDSKWGGAQTSSQRERNGMLAQATWWWGGQPSDKNALCRLDLHELEDYHEVKLRVDDDVSLTIDCEERLNTHKVAGWQWREVMTATFTDKNKMLTIHAFNQGGPGHWILTIDDEDTALGDWRCEEVPDGKSPEEAFPGYCKQDFDDSKWHGVVTTNGKAATPGMLSTARWVWGGRQAAKHVVCRLPLNREYRKMSITVDDEVLVLVDSMRKVTEYAQSGWNWQQVNTFDVPLDATVVAIEIYDQGGGKHVCSTLDGENMNPEGWRCMDVAKDKRASESLANWASKGFVDSNFYTPQITNIVVHPAEMGRQTNCWWPKQGVQRAVCRYYLQEQKKEIKMRVDDELYAAVNGRVVANAFEMPGWQHTKVFKFDANKDDELLAIKVYDQGGAQVVCGTIDGAEVGPEGWVCMDYDHNEDPDKLFKGWQSTQFADGDWYAPQVRNIKMNTPDWANLQRCWWPKQGAKAAVCRYRLKPVTFDFRLRVDDYVRVHLDGRLRRDTNGLSNAWHRVFGFRVPEHTSVIGLHVVNVGGPGEILTTLDGRDMAGDGWKCKAIPDGKNPDEVIPNWADPEFDDSDWDDSEIAPGKAATYGMNPTATWWWCGPQSIRQCVCRHTLNLEKHIGKIRVDDFVRLEVDGQPRVDTFKKKTGPQWDMVHTFSFGDDAKIITAQFVNGGGPGNARMTIDGEDQSGDNWRCTSYNSNPDTEYPGWKSLHYGDQDWKKPTIVNYNRNVPGINPTSKYWWVDSQGKRNVICRYILGQKNHEIKVRVDDELQGRVNGKSIIDTFTQGGSQWRVVNTIPTSANSEVLAIRVYDQGGGYFVCSTKDGVEMGPDGWLCMDHDNGKDPDELFPGWAEPGYKGAKDWYVPQVRNKKVNTDGWANLQQCWWPKAGRRSAVCRYQLRPHQHQLKVRVDDEVQVLVDGDERVNTFIEAGSQWTRVYATKFTDKNAMLAMRVRNTGGPDGMLVTIDDEDTSGFGWVCQDYDGTKDPEHLYPGWTEATFDDSEWKPVVVRADRSIAGMNPKATWFWGGEQSNRDYICRLRLNVPRTVMKFRIDDDMVLKVDGEERVNSMQVPGHQWTKEYTASITEDNEIIALRMFNGGGPGSASCIIGHKKCTGEGWVCQSFKNGEDPDELFPKWDRANFNDKDWKPAVLLKNGAESTRAPVAPYWWCDANDSGVTNCVCRYRLKEWVHKMVVRTDDDIDAFVDGEKVVNEFGEPGWQYTKVNNVKVSRDACMLAIRVLNQGGPGYIVGTINGLDMSGLPWKCTAFPDGQDPDELFPGWKKCNFNQACGWEKPNVFEGSTSGTEGIPSEVKRWWGADKDKKNIICRLHIDDLPQE